MLRDIRFLESRRNAPLLDLDYINLVRKVKKNVGLIVAFGFSFTLWSKNVMNICIYTE